VISSSLVIAAVAVAVVLLVVAALLVVRRLRSRPEGQTALPEAPPGSFACPFCKRPYDPAQTGRRCPGCGAAAPRG
jgi:Zn finger protein HypA/HybF involved in hydrogenase expression